MKPPERTWRRAETPKHAPQRAGAERAARAAGPRKRATAASATCPAAAMRAAGASADARRAVRQATRWLTWPGWWRWPRTAIALRVDGRGRDTEGVSRCRGTPAANTARGDRACAVTLTRTTKQWTSRGFATLATTRQWTYAQAAPRACRHLDRYYTTSVGPRLGWMAASSPLQGVPSARRHPLHGGRGGVHALGQPKPHTTPGFQTLVGPVLRRRVFLL